MELLLCRVNQGVFPGRKEFLSFLFFVVTFFAKGADSLNKVGAGCGFSDILEDIWGIL